MLNKKMSRFENEISFPKLTSKGLSLLPFSE